MSLDPIQLDYRRLKAEKRREDWGLFLFTVLALTMAATGGVGLAWIIFYYRNP